MESNLLEPANDDHAKLRLEVLVVPGWLQALDYHPNILVGNFRDAQDCYTLLDYVIAHGRLRESVAHKFAQQIANALAFCHHNRIVHRDIKLENIFLSSSGEVKITNFDLSAVFDPAGHLSTACGTSYFPAPEMLSGKSYVGPEVDIWGFGVVLYTLVCGRVPFDDHSIEAVHVKVRRGFVQYPYHLSSKCKDLLARMLTTDPMSRISLSEVLSHPWMVREISGRFKGKSKPLKLFDDFCMKHWKFNLRNWKEWVLSWKV
ncbi:kinase-like domain-containing protein [Mycena leptocephala]|nr:kinase-like domain-containing protein [Mycena leptocephala]